ncbi:MAG: CoA-binding protein [Haloarculaceae archaeon]
MPVTSDEELAEILQYDNVAVVGCSSTRGRDAHEVPRYLKTRGYNVIPVNPFSDEILGHVAYDSLSDVDEAVDVVLVFRPSDEVSSIVDEAIERDDVKAVWTQLGIRDIEALERAEEAGLRTVQDKCMKVESRRLKFQSA